MQSRRSDLGLIETCDKLNEYGMTRLPTCSHSHTVTFKWKTREKYKCALLNKILNKYIYTFRRKGVLSDAAISPSVWQSVCPMAQLP